MKHHALVDALSEIDDELILSVMPMPAKAKKRPWTTVLTIAAMAAICLFCFKIIRQAPPIEAIQGEAENTPIPEETVIPNDETLPMLSIGPYVSNQRSLITRYLGDEHLVYDAPSYLQEVPETLPVYQNIYRVDADGQPVGWEPDYDKMEELLKQYMQWSHWDGEIERSPYGLVVKDAAGFIRVSMQNKVEIFRSSYFEFPKGTGTEDEASRNALADYLLRKYDDIVPFEQTDYIMTSAGTGSTEAISVCFYEPWANAPAFFNPKLQDSITFTMKDSCLVQMEFRSSRVGEAVGAYPVLSPAEAKALFLQGYGIAPQEDRQFQNLTVEAMDLTYLNSDFLDYCMPFYRFLVQTGTERAIFLLPAVRPSYLTDTRMWKAPETVPISPRTAFSSLPEGSERLREGKQAFIRYFEENPGAWDFQAGVFPNLTLNGSEVRLILDRPLENGVLQSSTYLYNTAAKEIRRVEETAWNLDQIIAAMARGDRTEEETFGRLQAHQAAAWKTWLEDSFLQGELENCRFGDGSAGTLKFELWYDLLPQYHQDTLRGDAPVLKWLDWLRQTGADAMMHYLAEDFLQGELKGHTYTDGSIAAEKLHMFDEYLSFAGHPTPRQLQLQDYWNDFCEGIENYDTLEGNWVAALKKQLS